MNGPEAFRRLAQQIQAVSRAGGGGSGPGGRGAIAGSGLLIALVGGGLLLNASLFNGLWFHRRRCYVLIRVSVDGGHRAW